MQYPKHKYKKAENEKGYEVLIVMSAKDEAALGSEFKDSPADFSVETHPQRVAALPANHIPVFVAPVISIDSKKSRNRGGIA